MLYNAPIKNPDQKEKRMQPLERIAVQGFKSIKAMDLELRPLNVLIGANGAGKSNFIQVFALLNQLIEENLQSFVAKSGGANRLLYFGRKTTDEVEFRLTFGQNGYNTTLAPTADDALFFTEEECWFHDKRYPQPYIVDLGSGHRETRLFEESRKFEHRTIADHVIENIASWRIYQFHDTSKSAKVKLTGALNDNAFFRPNASNLAAFLYALRETNREHYDHIVRTVRLVAPFFDDFNLRPSLLQKDTIRLEWREKGSDEYFNASMLSDGTLRFISLATLLLQPSLPATVIIDEPELGLHPYAITLLTSMLRSAATKTQVIIATQSVPLVNQFSPEEIIVVDREDGQSSFARLQQSEILDWLDEYGIGDLWEKNVVGGRPQR